MVVAQKEGFGAPSPAKGAEEDQPVPVVELLGGKRLERRRPGRIETTNPHLITLMRREAALRAVPADRPQPSYAARDLTVPLIGAVVFWGVVGLAAWFY